MLYRCASPRPNPTYTMALPRLWVFHCNFCCHVPGQTRLRQLFHSLATFSPHRTVGHSRQRLCGMVAAGPVTTVFRTNQLVHPGIQIFVPESFVETSELADAAGCQTLASEAKASAPNAEVQCIIEHLVLPLIFCSFVTFPLSRRCPSTSNFYPLGKAAAFFPFNVSDIRVASASTANPIFFRWIWCCPIFIFLYPFLLVFCRLLKPWDSRKLSCGGVGRTMLNGCMSVAKITEVVDIARRQKSAGSERMDGGISPLAYVSKRSSRAVRENRLTLSIQKPPLRSIISKKSLYSLLLNQSSLAISKLLQKWHMLYFSPSMDSPSISLIF